jgi:hypothetical protein
MKGCSRKKLFRPWSTFRIAPDDVVRLTWKLLTKQPRLILLGLRALLLGTYSKPGPLPSG